MLFDSLLVFAFELFISSLKAWTVFPFNKFDKEGKVGFVVGAVVVDAVVLGGVVAVFAAGVVVGLLVVVVCIVVVVICVSVFDVVVACGTEFGVLLAPAIERAFTSTGAPLFKPSSTYK